jgi:hypothetical protein
MHLAGTCCRLGLEYVPPDSNSFVPKLLSEFGFHPKGRIGPHSDNRVYEDLRNFARQGYLILRSPSDISCCPVSAFRFELCKVLLSRGLARSYISPIWWATCTLNRWNDKD